MTNTRDSGFKEIVILEFANEAEFYLQHSLRTGDAPNDSHIISLDPQVKVILESQGISCVDSTRYFDSEAHARALRKSEAIFKWIEDRFYLEDSINISYAYGNALLWYSRFFIHHMLWLSELLAEIHFQHPEASFTTIHWPNPQNMDPLIKGNERYLDRLAGSYCINHDIAHFSINLSSMGFAPDQSNSGRRFWRHMWFNIGGWLHRIALKRMGKRRPFWAITHAYQGDYISQQIRDSYPDIPWVVRGERGGSLGKMGIVTRGYQMMSAGMFNNKSRKYMGEIWLRILQESLSEDVDFSEQTKLVISKLSEDVESDISLFSHRDVYFGQYFAGKLRTGIGSAIRYLEREVRAMDETLDLLHPRVVVTPFGRRELHALGELTQRKGIPGLLISHGSFTPTKNELEEMGWNFHSIGLLHGSYSHAALQTPLAEAFAQQVPTNTAFIRTGPLIWGHRMNRKLDSEAGLLRETLAKGHANSRIVVHAGTPKHSRAMHFHVYETPDEYIQALRDLVFAVDDTKDVFLIIKYRPSQISEDDLRKLLPESDRFCISVQESFLDVLAISDLLVSFSSTTIEEAFQNGVPVLLYGGGGRYQHVEAPEVKPDAVVKPGPVFSVKKPEFLKEALLKILEANGESSFSGDLFEEYVYSRDITLGLPQLVDRLLGSVEGTGKT